MNTASTNVTAPAPRTSPEDAAGASVVQTPDRSRQSLAVTPAQAAPLLGVSPWEVINLCESGSLPGALLLDGGPWAIPAASVAEARAGVSALLAGHETPDASACPAWCTLPADHDLGDDERTRLHEGPRFGAHLRGWGQEYGDGRPMSLDVTVDVRTLDDVHGLRELAAAAEQAASWLETAGR